MVGDRWPCHRPGFGIFATARGDARLCPGTGAEEAIALLQGRPTQNDAHAISQQNIAPERLGVVCQDQQ
jgi:hypothetical protein